MSGENELRLRLRGWMRETLDRHGWSADEWARRAGTSSTNLTRLLNGTGHCSLPNTETLAKLAKVANSQPKLIDTDRVPVYYLPVLDANDVETILGLGHTQQEDFLTSLKLEHTQVASVRRRSLRAFGVKIDTESMNAKGLLAGDVAIVEPADLVPPTNGALVAVLSEGLVGGYIYQPPFYLPASTLPFAPLMMDAAELIGRIMQIERLF